MSFKSNNGRNINLNKIAEINKNKIAERENNEWNNNFSVLMYENAQCHDDNEWMN